MADHAEDLDKKEETLIEKPAEKVHGDHDSSSSASSESDSEKKVKSKPASSPTSVKDKIFRLFGREKPVHQVFGGGKPADVFLWRNKKISAAVLGGATAVWVLFELLESPPRIPEVRLSEEPFRQVAAAVRFEINRALALLREIASGRDLSSILR